MINEESKKTLKIRKLREITKNRDIKYITWGWSEKYQQYFSIIKTEEGLENLSSLDGENWEVSGTDFASEDFTSIGITIGGPK